MNFKRLLSMFLCLALLLGCVVPLASCKKKDDDKGGNSGNTPGGTVVGGDNTTPVGKTTYTVQVKTVGGMPLKGVMVYVHKGDADYDLAALPQETNENGIATFELDTADHYSIQLDGVPKGYNVKPGNTKADRYPMDKTGALITVASAPITTGGFSDSYKLGDVMYDFTLKDVEGKSYKLSELLKTKKMVMLNFWYKDCSNCAYEFPYINAVYQDYKDELEILAINDYPSDTVDTVKGYSSYLGEDLKMPLIKVGNTNADLTLSRFPSEGYPTTVIIDRYGVIAMIEVGAVLGENKWQSVFDHFTAKDYEQKLINDASELTPRIEPTIQWTDKSGAEISNAFNSGDINVTYHPEENGADAKYAWPFIVGEYDGKTCIKPSNYHIDNSFSILYAEVELKPGQAITFDYFSSTQKNYDILYVLVDGKDIYSISGDSIEDGDWSTCCAYVDPRPILDSNKDEVRTYEVAFAYYKDDFDNYGDDTVYLKDLKVISVNDIDIETYIFRHAATDLNDTGSGYNTYAEVYLGSDGYYHVGKKDDANGENDPLLLANLLSYTNFDPYKTVSQRVYENYELMVDGVNMFNQWLIYGNAASNSQLYYYTAVTEDLAVMLKAYCDTYYRDVGKTKSDNLWLQLCAYYDAYGKDENGNPTKHLENPIQGLTDFSAFDVEINKNAVYESGNVIASGEVTYTRVIMPRGYLYKFVPEVSGVYRITSNSDKEVNGWIFVGSSNEWAENEGDRSILTHYDVGERISKDMLVDSNGDGIYEHDYVNTTLVAYMEAGTPYYIDIAYYDVYETGTFTFDVKWLGNSFGHFIQASPGPITYIESLDGSMGQLIAGGITPIFANAAVCDCGELVGYTEETDINDLHCIMCGAKVDVTTAEVKDQKYAFHLKGYDDSKPVLGTVIYADFYQPTTLFQSQSVEALIIAHAFNFTVTAQDREALIIIDGIKLDGKAAFIKNIVDPELVGANDRALESANAKWTELGMDAAVADKKDGRYDNEYTDQMKIYIEFVIDNGDKGKDSLIEIWTDEFLDIEKNKANAKAEAAWNALNMNEVMRYGFAHATAKESDYSITFDFTGSGYTKEQIDLANKTLEIGMTALKAEWGAELANNWADNQLTEIINTCLKTGKFHNTDNRTNKDVKAQEYLKYFNENGKAALMTYWDAEFASITPPAEGDSDDRTLSERRYDYFWDYYKMDEVKAGIFHGQIVDNTATIEKYVELMDNNNSHPERQGCVAVTEELAQILLTLVDHQVFEDVQYGWLKFCYYYNILGE